MNKLLVICGPTAVGKTGLAVDLAKKFDGELVSADSRQVYKGMDIATGKEKEVYGDIPVHLIDVIDPNQSFSVAQYKGLAEEAIDSIWKRKKLPILVGGTGFYIKAVVDGIKTLGVPPNPALRALYAKKSTHELFEVLLHLNPDLASSLNPSERRNKQRLIRRIEIEQSDTKNNSESKRRCDALFVGLNMPLTILRERINNRIDGWVEETEKEIKKLLASRVSWDAQSMSGIGYRQWRPYFEEKAYLVDVLRSWKRDEWQYARRQLTWFKKDKRINWFDTLQIDWFAKVEKLMEKWYDRQ